MATDSPIPSTNDEPRGAVRITVPPAWVDPISKAVYVHRDLMPVGELGPWHEDNHVPPARAEEKFGDVESWSAYVTRYASPVTPPFITWNATGMFAVLDYHRSDGPGRAQWKASYPFERSEAFKAWTTFAHNAHDQRETVEFLENHQPDIVEPSAGELLLLLRTLRTSVNKTASVTVNEDGTNEIQFQGGTSARGQNEATLPPVIKIQIQVLKGHVEPVTLDGQPKLDPRGQAVQREVVYVLEVRLRINVDNSNHPTFRFDIPLKDRVLEDVFADRVRAAQALLTDYSVLRAADRQ